MDARQLAETTMNPTAGAPCGDQIMDRGRRRRHRMVRNLRHGQRVGPGAATSSSAVAAELRPVPPHRPPEPPRRRAGPASEAVPEPGQYRRRARRRPPARYGIPGGRAAGRRAARHGARQHQGPAPPRAAHAARRTSCVSAAAARTGGRFAHPGRGSSFEQPPQFTTAHRGTDAEQGRAADMRRGASLQEGGWEGSSRLFSHVSTVRV